MTDDVDDREEAPITEPTCGYEPCDGGPCLRPEAHAAREAAISPRRKTVAPRSVKRRKKRRAAPKVAAKPPKVAAPKPVELPKPPEPPKRPDIFAGFELELKSIDWTKTVEREAKIHEVIGRLIVQVACVPELTPAEREKLTWVTSLARQMKDFRNTAEIDAALKKLNGEDEAKTIDGPAMEDDSEALKGEHEQQESSERGAGPTFRGRPRTRALA